MVMLQNAIEFFSLISGRGLMLWFRCIPAGGDQAPTAGMIFFRFVREDSKPSRDLLRPEACKRNAAAKAV